jgi:signal recognition particle GTPase
MRATLTSYLLLKLSGLTRGGAAISIGLLANLICNHKLLGTLYDAPFLA